MFKVVVGHSEDPDSQEAVDEVLTQCLLDLSEHQPQAGILFAAIDFDHPLILERIHHVFPDLALIGCTTDGEMSSILGFQQDSLTLMLFCSDSITIQAGVGHQVCHQSMVAAQQAIHQASLGQESSAKLCLTIPASYIADGSTTSGEKILAGLDLALGGNVPILGGTAGDQFRFKTTYQFFQTEVLTDTLPVLLFFGDLKLSHGTGCGWQPMGQKCVVTKAEGTVLYEIDGESALNFYHRYLGDRPPTAEHPICVYEEGSDRYYLRVPNTCDKAVGSINFLGNVPQGSVIQLTDISRDEVILASQSSLEQAMAAYPGTEPEAVLLFSCCCRRWLLGTRAKEEYHLVDKALPKALPVCGFYTYGEFSPLEVGGKNYYHQETFVTLLLGTK